MEKINILERVEKINRLMKENDCNGNALIKKELIKKSEMNSLFRYGYRYDENKKKYILAKEKTLAKTPIKIKEDKKENKTTGKINILERVKKINRLMKENDCNGNALITKELVKKSEMDSLFRYGYRYDKNEKKYILSKEFEDKTNEKQMRDRYATRNCQIYLSDEELNLLDSLVIQAGFLSRSAYISDLVARDEKEDIVRGNFKWEKSKIGLRFPTAESLLLMKNLAQKKGFGTKYTNYIVELIKRENVERQLSILRIEDIERTPAEFKELISGMKLLIEGLKEGNDKIIRVVELQYKYKISVDFIEEFKAKYTKLEEN